MENKVQDEELTNDETKSIFKSWWFWILLAILTILAIVLIYLYNYDCTCNDNTLNDNTSAVLSEGVWTVGNNVPGNKY